MKMTDYAIARCAVQAAERVNRMRRKDGIVAIPKDEAEEAAALIDIAFQLPEIRYDQFVQESQGVQRLIVVREALRKKRKEDS